VSSVKVRTYEEDVQKQGKGNIRKTTRGKSKKGKRSQIRRIRGSARQPNGERS